jgi:peptidoglycan DL-endopeptidase CwlO
MQSKRSRRLLPIMLALTLAMAFSGVGSAYADKLADKRAQAARIEGQIRALDTKAEIASEQYNAARGRYDKITSKVKAVEKRIAKLEKRQHTLQTHLNTRASETYRTGGPGGFLTVLLSQRTYEDFQSSAKIIADLNARDAATVSELKATKAEARQARATLKAAQKEAGQQKAKMAANKKAVEEQLGIRKRLLAGVAKEIQALVAKRMASQSIAEQARTMKLMLAQRSPSSGGVTLGGSPSSSKAGAALYYAEQQIGKPYVWAADGPDTFDCSGLMLFAYGKTGTDLSHYSGSQINEGKRVSRSDLKPGDLVFFGSPIHHVGMYVGGDAFLEAPYTGSSVRITRLSSRSDFAGACRP